MPVKPSKVGCLGTLSLSLGWGGLATPQGMSRWPRLNRGIAEIGLSAKGTAARFWGPFHNADSLVLSPCRARGEPRLVSKREFSAGRREQSLHIGWTKGWNVRGIATESGGKFAAEPNRGDSSSLTSESLEALADLRDPQSWYPTARRMKRRWILHVGPTNSGKTYNALRRLSESKSGCYCGPLRLLAWEVHDKMCEGAIGGNKIECDLVTGQEKVLFDGSTHRSSTIEMVDLQTRMQVGVVDEIQMVGDVNRGWAWTRAVLGLPVEELHICGEKRSVELMKRLCQMCGDDFEVREYDRLSPLAMSKHSLRGSLGDVQGGDCIVAFGRKAIYDIKRQIEKETSHRCCVVYGSLPPAARKEQARLFNERHQGESPYDVLVASDAVGMGLNLEIKRMIFSTVEKFDGKEMRNLTKSEILQIAGRAGRYGTESSEGLVTALHEHDMGLIKAAMGSVMPSISKVCIRPEVNMMEEFASSMIEQWRYKMVRAGKLDPRGDDIREPPLHMIIAAYMEVHRADPAFVLSESLDDLAELAEILQGVTMRLKDRFTFCQAPADPEDKSQTAALVEMAKMLSEDGSVPVLPRMLENRFREVPSTAAGLKQCEECHYLLELYSWLANHFEAQFIDAAIVKDLLDQSNDLIQKALHQLTKADVKLVKTLSFKKRLEAKSEKKKERRERKRRLRSEAIQILQANGQ